MSSSTITYIATFTGTNSSSSGESYLLNYIDDFLFNFNLSQNFLAAFPLSCNSIFLYFYSDPLLHTDATYKILPHSTDISNELRPDLCCFSSVESEYSINFSLPSSSISNYIEIVKIGSSDLDLSIELTNLQSLPELANFKFIPVNVSSSRVILSFCNSTEAIQGLRQLHDYVLLNGKSRDILIVPIQYDHLDVVASFIRSESSADPSLSNNFNTNLTFTQTIQYSFKYANENAFILNAFQSPTSKYVYLLVPSLNDKEIINNIGSVYLSPSVRLIMENSNIDSRSSRSNSNVISSVVNSNFIVPGTSSSTTFNSIKIPKKLYIFWDAYNCFLQNSNSEDYLHYINLIFRNIDELFNNNNVNKDKSLDLNLNTNPITIVDRVVIFFYPTEINNNLSPMLLDNLSMRGILLSPYSLKSGVDSAMWLEIEKIYGGHGMNLGSNIDSFSSLNNSKKFTSDIILGLATNSFVANSFFTKFVSEYGSTDAVCYYSDSSIDLSKLSQFKHVKSFTSLTNHKLFLNNPQTSNEANVDNLFPPKDPNINYSIFDSSSLGDISLSYSVFSPTVSNYESTNNNYEPSPINQPNTPHIPDVSQSQNSIQLQPGLSSLSTKFSTLSIAQTPETPSPFSNITCLPEDISNQTNGNSTPLNIVFPPASTTTNQTTPFLSNPNFISSSLNLLNTPPVKDFEFRIDVPSVSIFNYFKKLLEWGTPYSSVSISRAINSFGSNSNILNDSSPFFLSGENTIGYDSDVQYTSLVFDHNLITNTYSIIVKGRSAPHVELRFLRIKDMVEAVNHSRQFVILTNWTNDHYLALQNSEVLTRICELNFAWVNFHSLDENQLRHLVSSYPTQSNKLPQILPYTVTAEVLSLSPKNFLAISHFLLTLNPKEDTLRSSYSNINSQISSQLQYLHHKYAVKIDLKSQISQPETPEINDSIVNFYVWGFAEYIEPAMSSLLSFISSSHSNIASTPITLPTFTTRRHSSSNPPIYNSSFSSNFSTNSPFSPEGAIPNTPSTTNLYQNSSIDNSFSPYFNQTNNNSVSFVGGTSSVVSGGSGSYKSSPFSQNLEGNNLHSHYSVSSPNYGLNSSNSTPNFHQTNTPISHFSAMNSQSSPIISNTPLPAKETIKKIQRGTYSFADREAGIYYFAFEQQFREYLERTFGVIVEDCNTNSSSNPLEDGRPRNNSRDSRWSYGNNSDSNCTSTNNTVNSNSNFSNANSSNNTNMQANKNVVLKISYYGNSIKNVSAARPYLEQLNTTNLIRTQIFFPQVSAKKFKEIYNKKAAQLALLNNVRMRYLSTLSMSNNNELVAIDPLNTKGFINIRMKPPMHCQGIRRMILPTDVTVTICGSGLLSENEALIREIEQVFLSIKSDYIFSSVSIPYSHPMKRNLTIKSLREEIINRFGIVCLKWEEGCRATGSVGTAKIWASTQESMDAILNEIRSVEEQMLAENQSALSATSSSTPDENKNSDKNDENILSNQGSETKSVIYLPDLTLRYVLLGPPLSTQLAELLQNFSQKGIRAKYPYRDRTDPHAALLLEGETEAVTQATKEANNLVKHATRELKVVQVIVSEEQYKIITTNDLICVKYIQGQAGVHIKLDPTNVELDGAKSIYDFKYYTRLKLISNSQSNPQPPVTTSALSNASNPLKSLPNLLTESSIVQTGISQDYSLISTQIATPSPYRFCELMVYSPEVGSYPWINRVGAIIKIQQSETEEISPQLEISQTIDPVFNKPIITGLINLSNIDNIQEKMIKLGELVKKLVIYACESGVQDLAFLAPIGLETPALTQNHIRIATIEALFYVILSHRSLQPINSIVAVDEFDYQTYSGEPSKVIASMTSENSNEMYGTSAEDYLLCTDANENNKMVSTLLALIEQQSLHNQDIFPTPLPSISLLRCNCPLPSNLLTPFITSGYAAASSTYTGYNLNMNLTQQHTHSVGLSNNSSSLSGLNSKGFRTFLLKGLLPGINSGLGLLRNILTVQSQNNSHSLSINGSNR